jgi:ATP-dependent helicase/nuclease subunit B
MKQLGAEPDPAWRGTIVHRSLHEFFGAFPDALPADAEARLIEIADRQFDRLGRAPIVEAFWRPAFRRFARWFAATEPERRAGIARILTEVDGGLELASGFRITARADRIDVAEDGSVVIYDYKTGKPPLQTRVDKLSAPQLPLEAAIAAAGGFTEFGQAPVSGLIYISASGRNDGGEQRAAAKAPTADLATLALDRLIELVARYDDPETPYEVKRRGGPFANAYRYDDYEQLARVKEWLTQEAEEEYR